MKENDKVAGKVKILLLGDSAVGKSSLLTQYCDQDFSLGHMPTIGIEYKQKVLNLNNNKTVKIQLWDTAGHERFRTITPVYYRNVDGVLLIFDITQSSTFEAINFWINELNEKADVDKIEMMLVGNKIDLES